MPTWINPTKEIEMQWDSYSRVLRPVIFTGEYQENIFNPTIMPDTQFVYWPKKEIVYTIKPSKQYLSSAPREDHGGVSSRPKIFICEMQKHIFICFAKCGSSTLLNSISAKEYSETRKISWMLPQHIKNALNPYLKDYESKIKSGEYTIVLVWRDPIDRFVSACNMLYSRRWLQEYAIADYEKMIDCKEDVIDWILFCQSFEVEDEMHITPQHFLWKQFENEIPGIKPTIVVNSKNLKAYLTSVNIPAVDSLPIHDSAISKEDLTEQQKEEILKYAKKDFDLLNLAPVFKV